MEQPLMPPAPPSYVASQSQAITTQPGASIPMPPGTIVIEALPPVEGIPGGLEYLAYLDTIMVHQFLEPIEIRTGWETKNKYAIKKICYQKRQCCGAERAFVMHIVDNFNKEVLTVKRERHCCGCCCWLGSTNKSTIESPSMGLLGTVLLGHGCTNSHCNVLDKDEELLFLVDGQGCCTYCCCDDKAFTIKTPDTYKRIGAITKKWGGIIREAYTDADTFAVTFPADLDVKAKALLLATTFVIDFAEFESSG
ncbi:Phospholipid scramblase [Caenorhabditis elegans]|uniref:Phospholipid scramblase n=1 Tax=Caenorhabditis elegans TaxID=6239 RepID=G5EG07_CAEEL|nr:Phospholipid scramblase [Caenorhabditis elegans]ABQ01578.1 scramblase 3 [Caenorhabditis elegans]CCD62929.1 Phospholipid scramblase [Caenorhabditis elegans]|eukprot:NP_503934.2 Phospholipid scramblase [Caenorhabditis elegans]